MLEITESTVMGEPQRLALVAIIAQFRQLGVGLSLDGFGTGQASLAQLKWLPVNELKIDRSFVTTMASDRTDACIVAASVALAQSLGLRAVAEGVEDEAVWARLIEVGCDYAQGFFVSVPLPADELAQWLRNRHHVPACSVSGAVHVVV